MKPLHDLVMISLEEAKQKTDSGLFIQKAWEGPSSVAVVEAVGPEVKGLKKGDKVIINPYAYFEVPDSQLKFIKEEDVLSHV